MIPTDEREQFPSLDEKTANWKTELSNVFHAAYGGAWSDAEEKFHWWIEEQVERGRVTNQGD